MLINKFYSSGNRTDRRGAVIHLFALLLPVFIAFIAFAVDYGVINVAKHELQNAADAGAAAGIELLMKDQEQADLAAHDAITANILVGEKIAFDVIKDIQYGTWDSDTRQFTEIERTSSGSGPDDVSGDTIPDGATANSSSIGSFHRA